MKKILLLLTLLPALLYADEITKTNNPDVYVKNLKCIGGFMFTGNLINKSENKIYQARADFFDKDGDPINALRLQFLDIPPNTGKEIDFGPGCKEGLKYKITVW